MPRLLCVLLLTLMLVIPSTASAAPSNGESVERVVQLLLQYRADGDLERVTSRLAALNPPPMQSVIRLLSGRSLRTEGSDLAPSSDPREREGRGCLDRGVFLIGEDPPAE